jgi:hypothetical protein
LKRNGEVKYGLAYYFGYKDDAKAIAPSLGFVGVLVSLGGGLGTWWEQGACHFHLQGLKY